MRILAVVIVLFVAIVLAGCINSKVSQSKGDEVAQSGISAYLAELANHVKKRDACVRAGGYYSGDQCFDNVIQAAAYQRERAMNARRLYHEMIREQEDVGQTLFYEGK